MGYVYMIRNGDLYKIGRTDNLQRRLKQLQPCTVVQTLETDRSRDLEYELHKKYKSKRLPQTEYFRLSESQVEKVAVALGRPPRPSQRSGEGSSRKTGRSSSSASSQAQRDREGIRGPREFTGPQIPSVGYATPDSIKSWKADQERRAVVGHRHVHSSEDTGVKHSKFEDESGVVWLMDPSDQRKLVRWLREKKEAREAKELKDRKELEDKKQSAIFRSGVFICLVILVALLVIALA